MLARLDRWPEGLTARLALLERLDATTPATWYRDQWHAGRLELWACGPRCWVLLRLELMPGGGRELVIVGAVSDPRPGDAIAAPALAELEDLARAADCSSLRLHTNRAGLVALASAAGWQLAEHVLRKPLVTH